MHASLTQHRPLSRRLWWIAAAAVAVAAALAATPAVIRYLHDDSRTDFLAANGWPTDGQAAYAIGTAPTTAGPGQHVAPIASLAKVMTALVVLQSAPLAAHAAGFSMTVSAHDVADSTRRADRDESVVALTAGERLTERDALAAVLLPSANNVAVMLARHVAGSVRAFVHRMNALARHIGMTHTRYTDPSGYKQSTVSTAQDQVQLAQVAMLDPAFARLVALPAYRLPGAGIVRNTDTLLGRDGFVGIKTGSDDAAGGCFMFRSYRVRGAQRVAVTGVVLGQPGHNLILTGQYAARQLVDRVAPAA
jgi:serine-type D-Ala-D-Ala carboxypeptidase (penicillin-binding protein 5/6)